MTYQYEGIGPAFTILRTTSAGVAPLFEAFESGEIETVPRIPPPITGVEILEAATDPSPEWWTAWAKASPGLDRVPLDWALWFNSDMTAPQTKMAAIVTSAIEADRKNLVRHQVRGRTSATWSDLEALAWLASWDLEFVATIRAFAHQPLDLRDSARAAGLRYLRHHIAITYCQCASPSSLRQIGAAGACKCLPAKFDQLAKLVRTGKLAGVLVHREEVREIAKSEYLAGRFHHAAHTITANLIVSPGDVLFDRDDVARIAHTPKSSAKKRGRPRTVDRDEAYRLAKIELQRDPEISQTKCAAIIASTMGCDPRGMEKIIGPLWGKK